MIAPHARVTPAWFFWGQSAVRSDSQSVSRSKVSPFRPYEYGAGDGHRHRYPNNKTIQNGLFSLSGRLPWVREICRHPRTLARWRASPAALGAAAVFVRIAVTHQGVRFPR
jgi:hypothetical protein